MNQIIHDPFFSYLAGVLTGITFMAIFNLLDTVVGTNRLKKYMDEQKKKAA